MFTRHRPTGAMMPTLLLMEMVAAQLVRLRQDIHAQQAPNIPLQCAQTYVEIIKYTKLLTIGAMMHIS